MLRKTIKRILKEESELSDTEKKLEEYVGNDFFLMKLKKKVLDGISLNDEELSLADDRFDLESKTIDSIFGRIKSSTVLQSKVKKLGLEVYYSITKGNLNNLFQFITKGSKFSVGTPSDSWFKKNIDDLTFLKDNFNSNAGEIKWGKYESDKTFHEKIDQLIEKCEKKNISGILELENDSKDYGWSVTNKIDTNYMNWGLHIEDREKKGQIESGNDNQIIESYFKRRQIETLDINQKLIIKLNEYEKLTGGDVKRFSYAEIDLLTAFLNEESLHFQRVYDTVSKTTREGNEVENTFKSLFRNYPNTEIVVDFSQPGNLCDVVLGIDFVGSIRGKLFAVQVKSKKDHAEKAQIRKLGIDYLVIYPKSLKYFLFDFISQNKYGRFNKVMNNLKSKEKNTEEPKPTKETPKAPPDVDYIKYMGWDKNKN